jgi:hypothetical protein
MKTSYVVLVTVMILSATCDRAVSQKVGTSSFQFLKVMPGARATAMGDAYATLASGADAVFWNPSGITSARSHEVATSLTLWLFDTKQSAIAYALPLGELGTIAAQLQFVDYGDIEETRVDQLAFVGSGSERHYNPGYTGRTFSPSAYVIGVSYANQMTEQFAAGITAKYVAESLWGESTVTIVDDDGTLESVNTYARRVLFDFGMHYDTRFHSIQIGIAIQNLGSQVKFAKEEYPAPLAFRVGTAANLIGPDALLFIDDVNRVTVAYDIFQPNDYAQQMHLGMEYSFKEMFALRGGYKFNYDNDGLTLGAGVAAEFAGLNLTFDYGFGKMGTYLGNAHRLSLGVKF